MLSCCIIIIVKYCACVISLVPFHNIIIFILDNPPHLAISNITVRPINLSLSRNVWDSLILNFHYAICDIIIPE